MFERCDQPRFANHSRNGGRVCEPVCREDLDGNVTLQSGVVGAVDLTHAAGAERSDDDVRSEASARCLHAECGFYHPL